MAQTPALVLSEFTQKLDRLKNKSLQLIAGYHENREKVQHHLLTCKIRHIPVNLEIIASYPKADVFIMQVSDVQKKIISLRNEYLALLRNIK